uniref:M23ase beta-sheet core domain-containing protein n=1 Tax=viral metagenome TaxID=1070528 RepID=A0A2V0RIX2_9ZZZZ
MLIEMLMVSTTIVEPRLPLDENFIRDNKVNNTFGLVRNQKTKNHQGWDFEAPLGSPVYAIAPFSEHASGDHPNYGLWFAYKSINSGYIYFNAHLSYITPILEGTVGSVIGNVGNTGNAVNVKPHLHFEMRTEWSPGPGLKGRVSPAKTFGSWKKYLRPADNLESTNGGRVNDPFK